jgi:hypothetical protein
MPGKSHANVHNKEFFSESMQNCAVATSLC